MKVSALGLLGGGSSSKENAKCTKGVFFFFIVLTFVGFFVASLCVH